MANRQDPTMFMSPAEQALAPVIAGEAGRYRGMATDVNTVLGEIARLQGELGELITQNVGFEIFDLADARLWREWVNRYNPTADFAPTRESQELVFTQLLEDAADLLRRAGMLGKMKDLKRKVECAQAAHRMLPVWARR